MRGKLITFEGGEGSGKSTQVKLLENYLIYRKIPFCLLREPGGTVWGEEVRQVLLTPRTEEISSLAEFLLFLSARAQLVQQQVRPRLQQGIHVLLDRYIDSSVAYQGYGRGIDLELVDALNNAATNNLVPDLTLLYDINPEIGLQRAKEKGRDRIEEADDGFHDRVRSGYLALAEARIRITVLDGAKEIDVLHHETVRLVLREMGRP